MDPAHTGPGEDGYSPGRSPGYDRDRDASDEYVEDEEALLSPEPEPDAP
ncbi:hypothetical protein GCM10027589_49900 [Actinocorallia lasiicapitis]